MTEDRELLEAAARAAGIEVEYRRGSDAYYYDDPETGREQWYPLGRDGQALRLAVKLQIDISPVNHGARCRTLDGYGCLESDTSDPYAATRRAIVRAAAAIAGKETTT